MDALPTQQLGSPAFIRQHYISRSIKLYLIMLVILGLGVSYYGIERYLEYSDKSTVVTQSEGLLSNLEKDSKKEQDDFTATKTTYKDKDTELNTELSSVFPLKENYTDLTKVFDEYFVSKNSSNNPIIATDIQYGTPTSEPGSKYDILPISMNISASESNFYDFLRFIQNSGTLSKKLRLLDLKSIQLNFSDDTSSTNKNTIQFRAEVSAYFQKAKK